MPSRSVKQAKVMSAIAHGWKPKGSVAKIPVKVAKEFHAADAGHKYGKKHSTGGASKMALRTARRYARKAEGGADLGPTAEEMAAQARERLANQDKRLPLPDVGEPLIGDGGQFSPGLPNVNDTATLGSRVAQHLMTGVKDWVATPGNLMKGPEKVEHKTPGFETEEEAFQQDLLNRKYQEEQTNFGAGTAMGMLGMARMPGMAAPPNSVGAAGAKLKQPEGQFFHPYDLDPAEVKGAKQIGEQKGSNPGGMYELPSGEPVYIKTPQTHEHTYNEKLAAELYKAAGVPVADVRMTKFKGKPSIASPIVPGETLNKLSPDEWSGVKGIQENYPVDLWLGNYDFVGTGKDNIIVDPHNNAWRIDMGGALRFRAQGKMKSPDMWGPKVEHFDLSKSPDIADVIHPANRPYELPAAQRVADITDEQIGALVDKFGPLTKGEKPKLVDTLIKRRDAIAEMYGVKKGGDGTPPAAEPKWYEKQSPEVPEDMDAFFSNMEKEMLDKSDLNYGMEPYKPNFLEKASDKVDKFLEPAAKKIEEFLGLGKKKENVVPIKKEKGFITHAMAKENPELIKAKADQMAESYDNNAEMLANVLVDIAKIHGAEYADKLGMKLPESVRHDVGHHLDQMDLEAQQQKHFEEPEYAYDDDMAPKMDEGYHANETHYGKPILKYNPEQVKKWAQIDPLPRTYEKDVGFFRDLIKHANEPGNVIQRIQNFEDWVPPIQEPLIAPKTPNISPAKLRGLLFNPNFELYKGGDHEFSKRYPENIIDPEIAFGYGEAAFFLGDTKHVASGYGTVGLPYVLRAKNAIEAYLPHLTGELWEAKHKPSSQAEANAYQVQKMGAAYSATIFSKLINAGHHEGIDLIILHGISDNGAYNHTQYMLLKTKGNIRGLTAQFDPEHIHPSSPKSRSPLAGIVGGTPFLYGLLKNEQEDKDKKMARGGKTKFKNYSSVEIKARRIPKTMIHSDKADKALRTAKKLATGGAADEPQQHHFIDFKKGGMINSDIPGRTDEIPMKVTSGAYVLPADIPSALGQGNTMAGQSVLDNMFGGDKPAPKADGGQVDDHVPIVAAGGEYIIHPNKVKEIGAGDMSKGHKVLDKFVLHTRKEHIKTLKGLKPPK